MNNKVLVELIIPVLEEKYDVYLPVNRKIGNVIQLCSRTVNDLSGGNFVFNDYICLYNGENGQKYDFDVLVRNTNIRNGSKIVLM